MPRRGAPGNAEGQDSPRWILLIHAIPPRPAYLRVKVGRRLQKLGAVAVKNSVYLLPMSDSTREDLEWVAREIASDGGEASLCESRFIGGLTDQDIEQQFRDTRQKDYTNLGKLARRVADSLSRTERLSPKRRATVEVALVRLRKRLEEIVGIDYFDAPGRLAVESTLRGIENKLRPSNSSERLGTPDVPSLYSVDGRTWVTRKGIHVDRIASAWLIRRFIDPAGKFKYVEAKNYVPSAGELRFDMFDAEFTHEGDLCTFEVLLAKWGTDDAALRHIADMIHDVDLRDGKFGRQETCGVGALITGICLEHREDGTRLEAGSVVLDALYRALQKRSNR